MEDEGIDANPSVEDGDGPPCLIAEADGPLEAKYGLPPTVQFCKKCVYSNQLPSSTIEHTNHAGRKKKTQKFDADGVCDACNFAASKNEDIDWEEREAKLLELLDKYRSRNGSYDCLVPGSGGKDSVYAAHVLKTKYGMHPLTVTWAPHLYTDVGWRNFQSWIHRGGFDNYLFTPDGQVHRKLTRLAFENMLHPFQPFVIGQKNYAPRMAVRMGIPLVFYGENDAEYNNPREDNESAQRDSMYYAISRNSSQELYFGGVAMSDLPEHGIQIGQLDPYLPVEEADLHQLGVEIRYLGYYLKWIPQECYYYSVENIGFEANTERTEGTYSKYNSIDDKIDPYHYWTTLVKFGIGRTTYDASQEIRNHHLTREEGVALVHRFDQEFPRRFFPEFLEYLGLEEDLFFEIADRFRSPHLWRKTADGWKLRSQVTD